MRKSCELTRVKALLGNDNINISENFYELLEVDLKKLFKEYFDYIEKPKIIIEKVNGVLHVKIYLEAIYAKIFSTLPNIDNN